MSCCGTQPCNVTVIQGPTPLVGPVPSGFLTLDIGKIQYSISQSNQWVGGGAETLCCSPCDIALTVVLETASPTPNPIQRASGCLHLCVTGMFGLVTIPETTLHGYDTNGVKLTYTLTGSATITLCNGVRTIQLQNINITQV